MTGLSRVEDGGRRGAGSGSVVFGFRSIFVRREAPVQSAQGTTQVEIAHAVPRLARDSRFPVLDLLAWVNQGVSRRRESLKPGRLNGP